MDNSKSKPDEVNRILNSENYYSILNVSEAAQVSEIQKSFKELVLITHPDRNQSPGAVDAYIAVQKAANILRNKTSRKNYDHMLNDARSKERLKFEQEFPLLNTKTKTNLNSVDIEKGKVQESEEQYSELKYFSLEILTLGNEIGVSSFKERTSDFSNVVRNKNVEENLPRNNIRLVRSNFTTTSPLPLFELENNISDIEDTLLTSTSLDSHNTNIDIERITSWEELEFGIPNELNQYDKYNDENSPYYGVQHPSTIERPGAPEPYLPFGYDTDDDVQHDIFLPCYWEQCELFTEAGLPKQFKPSHSQWCIPKNTEKPGSSISFAVNVAHLNLPSCSSNKPVSSKPSQIRKSRNKYTREQYVRPAVLNRNSNHAYEYNRHEGFFHMNAIEGLVVLIIVIALFILYLALQYTRMF